MPRKDARHGCFGIAARIRLLQGGTHLRANSADISKDSQDS
jgi:hypothetical protein